MLEQVSGVMRALIINVNLQTSTILANSLILNAWLGPGGASAYWCITVLKIQTKIGKGEVKMKLF